MRDSVELTGASLTLRDLRRIALGEAHVGIAGHALARTAESVAVVDRMIDEHLTIYGVTTGFGGMAGVLLEPEQAAELQRNLLHFHRAGVGEPLDDVDVRAAMAIRANSALRGVSGLRSEVIARFARFLNEGITPIVRRHGSIGASGDLTPLAAIAGAVVGLDDSSRVRWNGREMPATGVLDALGLERLALRPKEALAMMNGTSVSAGMAANCAAEIRNLIGGWLGFHALAIQALAGSPEPFETFVHAHKPHPGQVAVAAVMRRLLAGSRLTHVHDPANPRTDGRLVQDRYSLRCIPQFIGPTVELLAHVERQVEVEINSATDNPLIDPNEVRAYHCGNFLAEHVATGLDSLRSHVGLMVKHVDAQLALMMAPAFSGGLPPSLVGNERRRVNMGLKAAQITANALMPLVVYHGSPIAHLFATHAEQYNQNVNSLSLPAAHLARTQLELARQHLGIALLCATQAVDLRTRLAAGHCDSREMLSARSAELYEAVLAAAGRAPSGERPLVYDDDDQILEEVIESIVEGLTTSGVLTEVLERLGVDCLEYLGPPTAPGVRGAANGNS